MSQSSQPVNNEYKIIDESEIQAIRRVGYRLQLLTLLEPDNPILHHNKILSQIIEVLVQSSTSKLTSKNVSKILINEKYNTRTLDDCLVDLKKVLGERFVLSTRDLSFYTKLKYKIMKYPLSEQTLVREAIYVYQALTSKKIETAYYPFNNTDRTNIYPELQGIDKVIGVDLHSQNKKKSNIINSRKNVTDTQEIINDNSIQLCVITPGTPVIGFSDLDYKFISELERVMVHNGLVVVPKGFIMHSSGGDLNDTPIPEYSQNILDHYKSLGQVILQTSNFATIRKIDSVQLKGGYPLIKQSQM